MAESAMAHLTPDNRIFLYKAILVSLLLHIIIFRFFVFTFTADSAPTKPLFVFLGSILQKEDFHIRQSSWGQPKETISVTLPKSRDQLNLPYDQLIPKPSYSASSTEEVKASKKTTFYNQLSPALKKDEPKEILGIDVSAPKRLPLKIK